MSSEPVTGETALALLRAYQAAEAEVNRLEGELAKARQARDEALGAVRMFGKPWEQRR